MGEFKGFAIGVGTLVIFAVGSIVGSAIQRKLDKAYLEGVVACNDAREKKPKLGK